MDRKNSEKLKNLNWLILIAIVFFVIALVLYFYNFRYGLSGKGADWGTFGDFMGGTLNPIFALLSLFAIIYTIRIQTQELEYSREELQATKEELEKSRIAQEEQSESFKIQNDSIKLQTFENTFFQLITLFLDTRKSVYIDIEYKTFTYVSHENITPSRHSRIEYKINKKIINNLKNLNIDSEIELYSYEAIAMYLKVLKCMENYDVFNDKFESNTGIYFGQMYQLLKFINGSAIVNKQFYVNIFRAQFAKEELEFLFYHCLGTIGSRRFKKLVEFFEFFEHLSFNKDIKKNICKYHISAYGNNELLLTKYAEQSVVLKPNI